MTESRTVATLCSKGIDCLNTGAPKEALALFEQALSISPDDARTFYLVAIARADQRDLRGALDALRKSLELDPTNAKAHNNLGSTLEQLGFLSEARASYQRAMELDPSLDQPYLNLGKLFERTRDIKAALAVYDAAIQRQVNPEVFVQNRAALLGQNSNRSPDLWVKSTFDNFAPTFEQHLRDLQYVIPRVLASLVRTRLFPGARVVDLGCGTGLVGDAIDRSDICLLGVDLSPRMLVTARSKGRYGEICEREIHEFLGHEQDASLDGALAADVLIYVGDLSVLFAQLERSLRHGGFFAFSTEECEDADFKLLPTGRYAHSHNYIRSLAGDAFAVERQEACVIRLETGTPVVGRTYLIVRR